MVDWCWVQDNEGQGRAICRELGLALLVAYGDGAVHLQWRFAGQVWVLLGSGERVWN